MISTSVFPSSKRYLQSLTVHSKEFVVVLDEKSRKTKCYSCGW